MPRGPKGQKRPRDTNHLAKLMVDILTGRSRTASLRQKNKGRTRLRSFRRDGREHLALTNAAYVALSRRCAAPFWDVNSRSA